MEVTIPFSEFYRHPAGVRRTHRLNHPDERIYEFMDGQWVQKSDIYLTLTQKIEIWLRIKKSEIFRSIFRKSDTEVRVGEDKPRGFI